MSMYLQDQFIAKLEKDANRPASGEWIERTVSVRETPIGQVVVTFDKQSDDLSWDEIEEFGTFGRYAEDYAVDCRNGLVLGVYQVKTYKLTPDESRGVVDDDAIEALLWAKAAGDGWQRGVHCTGDLLIENETEFKEMVAELEIDGYPILKSGIGNYWGRHVDENFFYPEWKGEPPNAKSIEQTFYMVTSFGETWEYLYLTVTVYYRGQEIGFDACGGFSSLNMSKGDWETTFEEMLSGIDVQEALTNTRESLIKSIETTTAEIQAKIDNIS